MIRKALLSAVAGLSAAAGVMGAGPPAMAQASTPYLGQLMLVGFNFCPRGWIEANGQIMPIAPNTALFSLFGTTYGGDGVSTFALPDLRGRIPAHTGNGPGLAPVVQGEMMGTDSTTLLSSNLPRHTHQLFGTSSAPDNASPNNALVPTFAGTNVYSAAGAASVVMKPTAIGPSGNNLPFDQHQPTLVLRWCVALEGVYPSRP